MAKIYTPIPNLKLSTGQSMPMLAFGLGTAYSKSKLAESTQIDQELVKTLKIAIDMGYYHLDCAENYKTETELGIAIKESGIEREKFYITTKVWHDHIDDIAGSLKMSLKKLQLDYVDLFVINSPFWTQGSEQQLQEAWRAMEQVYTDGLAKSIGVSNYRKAELAATLATAKVAPSVNQIEFHPYLQHGSLLEYHRERNIVTQAYGTLAPATEVEDGPIDGYLASLARKYAVNKTEILLRFCVDQDIVPITTSSKEQRLSDYLRSMTFKLTPVEIRELKERGEKFHFRRYWKNEIGEDDRS